MPKHSEAFLFVKMLCQGAPVDYILIVKGTHASTEKLSVDTLKRPFRLSFATNGCLKIWGSMTPTQTMHYARFLFGKFLQKLPSTCVSSLIPHKNWSHWINPLQNPTTFGEEFHQRKSAQQGHHSTRSAPKICNFTVLQHQVLKVRMVVVMMARQLIISKGKHQQKYWDVLPILRINGLFITPL